MMRNKIGLVALTLALVLSAGVLIRGVMPLTAPPTGTWAPTSTSLAAARSGASAALLSDGRVLITGGCSAAVTSGVCSVPLASAEFLNADGNFYPAPNMNYARSGHTAALLPDGRVLVAGGADASGSLQTAEIYDPVANAWTATAGPLMAPRSGHTATLLQDGTVLIAGGSANGAALNSLELFDPSQSTFSSVSGNLSSARESHAATALSDGRVLIMGGWDGTTSAPAPPANSGNPNVLSSTDIYDPASGTVAPGPAMSTARMKFTATVQHDGKVAAIGGSDGQNDLASIEIFDSTAGSFAPGGSLTTARSNHLAFLLPHNANILVVGGTSSGVAISGAELYCPWAGTSSATGSMSTARAGALGSPLYETVQGNGVGIDGALMVAGGLDANNSPLATSEVYGFATLKTDAADYPPGTTVNISGSGWQPNETVQMSLVEVPDLDSDSPIALTATADSNGNISVNSFATNAADANIKITLTAVGAVSQAQMTFTDAGANKSTFSDTAGGASVASYSPAIAANQCRDGYIQSRQGNSLLALTSSQAANLSSSPVGATFYSGSGCAGSAVTSVTIASGHSSAAFSFKFAAVGNGNYTINGVGGWDTGGNDASATATVYGSATHFSVTGHPSPVTAGSSNSFTVTALDVNNNTAVGYTGTVTFSSSDTQAVFTPGSYTLLAGDNGTHTSANGATLKTAGTQSITATDGVKTGSQTGIVVNAAGPAVLAFNLQPGGAIAGSPLSPQPVVWIMDSFGNHVTSGAGSGGPITLSIVPGTGTGGAVLACTTNPVTAVAGVAAYAGCNINLAGNNYQLRANISTPQVTAQVDSTPFNINPATVATTLVLNSVSPNSVPFGSTGPATLTATLTRNDTSAGVVGATVNFKVDGAGSYSATTGTGGVASFSTYDPSALTVAGHNVQASFAAATVGGQSYLGSTTGTLPLTVNKADQTITFGALPDKTYGDADFNVSATASSNLTVSFTASGICTVAGTLVHITGAGSCTITAHQAGDGTHNAAPDVPRAFTISQATATIHVTAAGTTYTGLPYAGATTCTADGVNGEHPTATMSFEDASHNPLGGPPTNAGSYFAKCSAGGAGTNYLAASDSAAFTIDKATSTTVVTFEIGPYIFRGTAFTATAAVTGAGGLNSPAAVSYSGDCANVTVANGCTATANFGGDPNHYGSSGGASITILPAPTQTAIQSSLVSPPASPAGITLKATVTPSVAPGSVTFYDTSTALSPGTPLGTVSLTAGQATLPLTQVPIPLAPGQHIFQATYNPSSLNFAPSSSATTNPAVNPVAIITAPASGALYAVNNAVSFSATFTDSNASSPSAQWSFSAPDNAPGTSGSFGGTVNGSGGAGSTIGLDSHTFTYADIYNITLTFNDGLGGIDIENTVTASGQAAGLPAYVVVYDPSAGFVTGGGWIMSPQDTTGTYPYMASAGQASFGFVSQYHKGATVPTGNTEFQFQTAKLDFKSTAYTWLVVSGALAQYQGTGTINGSGTYYFMLTAKDGALLGKTTPDGFRIKIATDSAFNNVVYDNKLSSDNSMTTGDTEDLGGGSIVIHSK